MRMPGSSSDCGSHLSLLNTLLAFRSTHPVFPSPLRDAGYSDDVLVEWDFATGSGVVGFDLIANNPASAHALLVEVKSSAEQEEARERFRTQVARHRGITMEDVQGSGITLGENAPTFDLVVATRPGSVPDLLADLGEQDTHAVLVLSVMHDEGLCCLNGCRVDRNALSDPALQAALSFELPAPVPIPDHAIPFDLSSTLLEIAVEVLPVIQTLYFDSKRNGFTQSEVGSLTVPAWDLIQANHRQGLGTRIRAVLRGFERAFGDSGFYWDNPNRCWTFRQPGDVRATGSPPGINRQVLQVLAREWDLEIEQLDAFGPQP